MTPRRVLAVTFLSHSLARRRTTQNLATEDLIDSRIGVHDSNHFEVKLDYSVDSTRKRSRYRVECYLFVPRSLGINRHSYPREYFYSDVQGYIRFKTPVIGLRTLADAADPLSPLGTIDSSIDALRSDPRSARVRRRLGHELRMFGCIARVQVRDRVAVLRAAIRRLPNPPDPTGVASKDFRVLVDRLLADLTVLLGAWRQRRVDFVAGDLPSVVCEIFAFTDEYLSQILEQKLTSLVADLDGREPLADVRTRLCEELLAERRYRKAVGYDSAEDGDTEHFVFRRSMLKKLVNSVLWLEISKQKDGRGLGNLGAAIAAGAAMAFALIVTLYGSRWGSRWVLTDTWAFVLAGSITYIFKDRIKDWLKGFFSSQTGRWLADYATDIRDPVSGRGIGRCRESFAYLDPDSAPADVLARRHRDSSSPIEPDAKPEIIIKYDKDIRLSSASLIERLHLADYEINDIMRFSMAQFLVRADDPIAMLPVYDPETDVVSRREFRKTYHLNLVMVMRCAKSPAMVRRIRVIFDKHGIRRLEEA